MANVSRKDIVALLERRQGELRARITELEAQSGDDRRDTFWRLMRLARRS